VIDGQPLACFQPFIDTATGRIAGVEALGRLRQADGQLVSVGPLFADPRTPAIALRRLDRQIRDNALSRLHEAPPDWFLSLNMSPRWISRLRADQPLPSLKQCCATASTRNASCSRSLNWAAISASGRSGGALSRGRSADRHR
jgi:EAL domain-containing protein (putative c-di-GMP-specific phosphodiesterase class I)